MVVISYHISASDPFNNPIAEARQSYYAVTGTPTIKFDGVLTQLGGTYPNGTMYSTFRNLFNQRTVIPSDLDISLDCTYDSIANSGDVTAEVTNTTGSSIEGVLHFVVVDSRVGYTWTGRDFLDWVARDMLPDANGEEVTIPASDSIIRSRNFTIDPTWNERKCHIVVFVQHRTTKEIYQGAEVPLFLEPDMQYYGMSVTETSGNSNGYIEPGESAEMKASAINDWYGEYTGGATIQCSDPYITITGSTSSNDTIVYTNFDTVVTYTVDIDPACPDPHLTAFELDFGPSIDSIPFLITSTPGFSDDIESGIGGWTHSGQGDNWHITEHKSHSPTHSWYCGLEGSWLYTNNNNSSLVSPYFVAVPDGFFKFWHQYNLETNYDFGYFEIDNGSGWWTKIAEFNGMMTSWNQSLYPLTNYAGQTVRLRYRIASDGSVTREGWYIDDVLYPSYTGAEERIYDRTAQILVLQVYPNPFGRKTDIRYQIPDNSTASLKIYDALGRVIKQFNNLTSQPFNQISWDGTDDHGVHVPAGVYFMKLTSDTGEVMEKVILLK